jgi:hypothetical protein
LLSKRHTERRQLSPIGEGMGKEKGEPSSGVKMGPEHPPPPPRPTPGNPGSGRSYMQSAQEKGTTVN